MSNERLQIGYLDVKNRPVISGLNTLISGDNTIPNWTGTYNLPGSNLNTIPNRSRGMIVYVTGDNNLYVCRTATSFLPSETAWERIITSSVDTPTVITGDSLTLGLQHNSLVLQINSPNLFNINLPTSSLALQSGFNVTFVQLGDGQVQFNNSIIYTLRNRLSFNRTAGKYAVASLLRLGGSADILLYGDLV